MKRWNGWGDEAKTYPAPKGALAFLQQRIGPATPPVQASFHDLVQRVPASRLPDHPLLDKTPATRLRHARGQSLPDWVALRYGRLETFPDAVAFPTSDEDVSALLALARQWGAAVVPYGGGTSVVGHVNPPRGERPVLTVALARLNKLLRIDERGQLAVFQAGVTGPDLEAQLAPHGLVLGHYPQSFEYATLGGWIATRSSGQQSARYGRIEHLFAGGRLQSPRGAVVLPVFPASAAGPDLREVFLGSEGRFGILTEAAVHVTAIAEQEAFHAVFFPDWGQGRDATRRIAQARLGCSMLRLSTASETETMLALAGRPSLTGALARCLSMWGISRERCMLMLAFTGSRQSVAAARRQALAIAAEHGGLHIGKSFGEHWARSRFKAPYLRNTLWELGYAVDTLETAVTWDRVELTLRRVERSIRDALDKLGERVHVFTHLSHVYPTGSSVYTTYLFRLSADPEETLHRWGAMKHAASCAIIDAGGTISHQHGVGADHAQYLEAEKGALGMDCVRSVARFWDPEGIMNPGKLLGE